MPTLTIKYEKANDDKTIIENLDSIALSLEGSKDEILQFMKYELHTTINSKKNSITCTINEIILNEKLFQYIREYILCSNCNNPETYYSIHSTLFNKKCKACGFSEKKLNINNLVNYIIICSIEHIICKHTTLIFCIYHNNFY